MDYDDWEEEERGPSRSALKREAEALQELGETLVGLNSDQLKEIPLDDKLREAIRAAQRIRERGAHKRQLQYIGKLMRQVDPEPIRTALDRIENRSAEAVAEFHAAERWRERLLAEDDALTEFLNQHPAADSQRLRQLIRSAKAEQAAGKPPKSYRELFRFIRQALGISG